MAERTKRGDEERKKEDEEMTTGELRSREGISRRRHARRHYDQG